VLSCLMVNSGQFVRGERRWVTKNCDTCRAPFQSASGRRKRCPSCCCCLICGAQLPNASHATCGNSCAGKLKMRRSPLVAKALSRGRELAHGALSAQRAINVGNAQRGKPRPAQRGCGNPNWRGGTGEERHAWMGRVEYKLWRATVFKRDGHCCVMCADHAKRLEAHHIVTWQSDESRRFDVSNGVTLCPPCHNLTRKCETTFEGRFVAYVASASPVTLTTAEAARFASIIRPCRACGTDVVRPQSHAARKAFFCNRACQMGFLRSGGKV